MEAEAKKENPCFMDHHQRSIETLSRVRNLEENFKIHREETLARIEKLEEKLDQKIDAISDKLNDSRLNAIERFGNQKVEFVQENSKTKSKVDKVGAILSIIISFLMSLLVRYFDTK